jgi:hypothetical protein
MVVCKLCEHEVGVNLPTHRFRCSASGNKRQRVTNAPSASPTSIPPTSTSNYYPSFDPSATATEVRLLSWNICFDTTQDWKARMLAIGAIIEREKPHIIALQEVTPIMLLELRQQRWLSRYFCSDRPNVYSLCLCVCVCVVFIGTFV